MDLCELDGSLVLAVVFGTDSSVRYARGMARCEANEVVIVCEDGNCYKVPSGLARSAMPVDDAVLASAPQAAAQLLSGVAYVVAVPPSDGDFAIARTPGWKGRPAP